MNSNNDFKLRLALPLLQLLLQLLQLLQLQLQHKVITTILLQCTLVLSATLLNSELNAGPFPPAAGVSGSTAIASTDPSIVGWASAYTNYNIGNNVDAEFQTPNMALGEAGNSDGSNNGFVFDIVSLGEAGSITLTFDQPIANGSGADLLVFENSFSGTFLELAWVEVSSNGIDFIRFINYSITPSSIGAFGNIDTTNIFGYGGKYRGGFGAPFDLEELKDNPLLDVSRITHVRIVDIVGDGSALDNFPAPNGPNPIYDPFPSAGSAGFDLDAIAVIHFAEPTFEENVPFPAVAFIVLACALVTIRQFISKNKLNP